MLHDSRCPECLEAIDEHGNCASCDWYESDEPLDDADLYLLTHNADALASANI